MTALLEVTDLRVLLHTGRQPVRAVDGLSLAIHPGKTFALLGESGSGKSITALSIMRLLPDAGEIVHGSVRLNGDELLTLPESVMRKVRGNRIGMIFSGTDAQPESGNDHRCTDRRSFYCSTPVYVVRRYRYAFWNLCVK